MNEIIQTFLLAMTPLGELRAAIPVALGVFHLNWVVTYFISVIGNLIPVIFLLLFLEPVSKLLCKNFKVFQRFFTWLFERTRRRADSKIKKYGYPALIAFVAIPLPITGAWTGSLIAFLFNIPLKKAFPLITAGVAIAGLIVVSFTRVGIVVEKYFGLHALLIIAMVGIITGAIIKGLKTKKLKN